jgi:hypothetical protein
LTTAIDATTILHRRTVDDDDCQMVIIIDYVLAAVNDGASMPPAAVDGQCLLFVNDGFGGRHSQLRGSG